MIDSKEYSVEALGSEGRVRNFENLCYSTMLPALCALSPPTTASSPVDRRAVDDTNERSARADRA